jgi:hypothetical protein
MTFLTRFCDLWDAYKKDAMLRLYRRLEYEIRSIAMSIINLAAEAATVLPNDEVTQIKNVGFELRSLEDARHIGRRARVEAEGQACLLSVARYHSLPHEYVTSYPFPFELAGATPTEGQISWFRSNPRTLCKRTCLAIKKIPLQRVPQEILDTLR